MIHVFDLPTGLIVRSSADNTVTKLTHKMTVSSIALSQTGPISERQLALLDYNRDLYVVTVKDSKPKFVKLGKYAHSCGTLNNVCLFLQRMFILNHKLR